MEAVALHLVEHSLGVLETVFGKFVVALPVNTEPTRIEVDNIGGNLMLTQFLGNIQSFFLREVSDTAHPGAERPQGQHGTLSCNIGIFIENILRFAKEHKHI